MLPPTIPIFPLPNVVLFPNVFLPLHIFEPRYRAMVADALKGDRIIGMALLRPGFEASYEGRPPVYPIGCAGVITHTDPLPDGRSNIVLRGLRNSGLPVKTTAARTDWPRSRPCPNRLPTLIAPRCARAACAWKRCWPLPLSAPPANRDFRQWCRTMIS